MQVPELTNQYGNVQLYNIYRPFVEGDEQLVDELVDQAQSPVRDRGAYSAPGHNGLSWVPSGITRQLFARLMEVNPKDGSAAFISQANAKPYNDLVVQQGEAVEAERPQTEARFRRIEVVTHSPSRRVRRPGTYSVVAELADPTRNIIKAERRDFVTKAQALNPSTSLDDLRSFKRPAARFFTTENPGLARALARSLQSTLVSAGVLPRQPDEQPKRLLVLDAPAIDVIEFFGDDASRAAYFALKDKERPQSGQA